MITKERLIAGLKELLHVEEEMVTLFANFSKALVNQTESLEEGKKKEIGKLLSTLHRDSSKHKEVINKMISHIGADAKDEY